MTKERDSLRHRFVASIDDAGDVVFVVGDRVTLGHAAAGEADVELLGDVDPVHATFELGTSFHGGAAWSLRAHADGSVRTLHDGDDVSFGPSAAFVVKRPDVASSALVLELRRGTDCCGARRVLLMPIGAASRVRIGAKTGRHVLVAGLAHDVVLSATESTLALSCDGGIRGVGTGAEPGTALDVPLPIEARLHVEFGAAPDRRPPFGVALAPLTR